MILSKEIIIDKIDNYNLISNVRKIKDSNDKNKEVYDLQPASYDLSVGVIVKKRKPKYPFGDGIQKVFFDPDKSPYSQETVTLEPGQILFIITKEDINMPKNMCGTVYSKNNLSLNGILAWTTGHVDPGFKGPIIIRLINLRSTNYSIKPGDKVYTIVFDEVDYTKSDFLESRPELTREKAMDKVTESANSALSNALFDLALLNNFVKKEEFGRILTRWLFGSFWNVIRTIIAFILFVLTTAITAYKAIELFKHLNLLDG